MAYIAAQRYKEEQPAIKGCTWFHKAVEKVCTSIPSYNGRNLNVYYSTGECMKVETVYSCNKVGVQMFTSEDLHV